MLGDYNGMVKFKQDLTHQLHHLNSLFNHELLQLFECASNQDKFDSMNVGDNFRVKLPNHCRVKAVKRNSEEFVYYFCGRFEREAVHNEMVLSPEPAPRFRLFQDPQNPHKQYIISRAHIDRICIVQLVCGRQYATLNISNDELKAFYDYMDFEGLTIVNPD
ncbi:hypothetical protein EAY15_21680 [Vibrio anguillarum]|nr:hypothetical protein [Vibrio anguillarum]